MKSVIQLYTCDFCGERTGQINGSEPLSPRVLIVPNKENDVAICCDCIDVCAEVVAEQRARFKRKTKDIK